MIVMRSYWGYRGGGGKVEQEIAGRAYVREKGSSKTTIAVIAIRCMI